MHLWKVTNTEAGDRPREYRCAHCGAVTRDDDRHPPPPCTEERERDACDALVSGEVKAFSGICKGLEEQLKQTMRERDQLRAELEKMRANAAAEYDRQQGLIGEAMQAEERARAELDAKHAKRVDVADRFRALRAGVKAVCQWADHHRMRDPPVGTKQHGYVDCAADAYRQLTALLVDKPESPSCQACDDIERFAQELVHGHKP